MNRPWSIGRESSFQTYGGRGTGFLQCGEASYRKGVGEATSMYRRSSHRRQELVIRALILAGVLVAWVLAGERAAASESDLLEVNSLSEESRRLSQRNYDFQNFLQMRSKRPAREHEMIEQIKQERQREEATREAARREHIRTRQVYSMAVAERLEQRDEQRRESRERRQEARRRRYIYKRDLMRDLADRMDRVDVYRELDLQPNIAPERKVLGTK